MLLPIALLSLLHLATTTALPPQHIFTNPPPSNKTYKIPTIHESAILARRILNLSSIATLSTVFPTTQKAQAPTTHSQQAPISQDPSALWSTPSDLSGAPIGLMDYYASCFPQASNPTILAISIATTFRNSYSGSNVTLSLRHHPPPGAPPSDDIYTYSPANMPRFSLIGYIEEIPIEEVMELGVWVCFLDRHPDAEAWFPGNEIHESRWVRLVVREVYWIGGFGDRAYIGWIPEHEWRGVKDEEIEKARLVGEEGYEAYVASRVLDEVEFDEM
ncbi:hypothetical protein N7G274_004453 [Stereocaulon virgatum]|uniref:CREG-like beta-barrel domain-containing protein n=1 Tax=Stereocaulon virgatum TaxID=373712 RepID=A0ABR4AD98_9LECA